MKLQATDATPRSTSKCTAPDPAKYVYMYIFIYIMYNYVCILCICDCTWEKGALVGFIEDAHYVSFKCTFSVPK